MALTTASAFSDKMEFNILSWFKGTAFPAVPTNEYVGLFTTNPADAGTNAASQDGTEMTTTNGTTGFAAYARQVIAPTTGWNAIAAATGDSTGQQITNNAALNWPANNSGGSTVTVSGIGIYDAVTAGNLLFWIALGTPQAVTSGATFSISAGNLVVQVD